MPLALLIFSFQHFKMKLGKKTKQVEKSPPSAEQSCACVSVVSWLSSTEALELHQTLEPGTKQILPLLEDYRADIPAPRHWQCLHKRSGFWCQWCLHVQFPLWWNLIGPMFNPQHSSHPARQPITSPSHSPVAPPYLGRRPPPPLCC